MSEASVHLYRFSVVNEVVLRQRHAGRPALRAEGGLKRRYPVPGVVAAVSHQDGVGAVELKRMAVDRGYRRRGVGVLLGQEVLEFASTHGSSAVFLGTTAYTAASHKLYQMLGFRCIGVTNAYATPCASSSLLEWVFFRVRHHHYRLDLPEGQDTMATPRQRHGMSVGRTGA